MHSYSALVQITIKLNAHVSNVEAIDPNQARDSAKEIALDKLKAKYPDLCDAAFDISTDVTDIV